MGFDDNDVCFRCRSREIILIKYFQPLQMWLHGLGSHQGEEGINAIFGKVIGQSAEEKPAQCATKPKGLWIPLAISKAPRGKVERCEVMCKISIASSKSNSITENGTADGIACRTS